MLLLVFLLCFLFFFFSSRRRHTRSYGDWSSDVCSSDLVRRVQDFLRTNRAHGSQAVAHRAEHHAGACRAVGGKGAMADRARCQLDACHPVDRNGGAVRRTICPQSLSTRQARAATLQMVGPTLAGLLLLTAVPATLTVAQTVRGLLTDSVSRAPLAGAFLTLIDERGAERARAMTNGAGEFTLNAPAAGTYRLRSKRTGFRPLISPPLAPRAA